MTKILDPNNRVVGGVPHLDGCTCVICDKSLKACPTCGKECRGLQALGAHIAWTHKRRRRGFASIVVPGEATWLTHVLRDPHRSSGLHLENLPRFAGWLLETWKLQPQRMRRTTRNSVRAALLHASELAARSPDERCTLPTGHPVVPAVLGEAICLLALETNTPIRHIVTAMLAYGMEAFAKELRASNYAPTPKIPTARTDKNDVRAVG